MNRLIMLLVVTLLMPGTACADSLGGGDVAYEHGDYATALRLYQIAAAHGDPDAQFMLGFMYARGHALDQDQREIVTWAETAADESTPGGLPRCPGSYSSDTWTHCLGDFTHPNGTSYVGEWLDGALMVPLATD
ncbi:MAG: sel1 repeat family protein [Candidatus Nitrotoga sp.]|nr:sel1 repeat family protein [Candidatus Nitrotoga sp.]MBP0116668.1 sel1 repeat family protein [Candidatus Nitrotoga sp.]MBP0126396.1 sel1 repeat family protein [Candidatus Nitrotoga sp.]